MKRFFAATALLLFLDATVLAEALRGKIIAAAGQQAEIKLDSGQLPSAGDAVTIYFKLPGVDDEVLVGTGRVASVTGGLVKATIDNLKGTLQKDQLARINASASPPKISSGPTSSPTPSASMTPVTPPYVAKLSVIAAYDCDDGGGNTLTDTVLVAARSSSLAAWVLPLAGKARRSISKIPQSSTRAGKQTIRSLTSARAISRSRSRATFVAFRMSRCLSKNSQAGRARAGR